MARTSSARSGESASSLTASCRSGTLKSPVRATEKPVKSFPYHDFTRSEGTPPMIKSKLVQIIANRNPQLFLRDVENIVNAIFEEITEALADGNRVELRGFGAFSVKNRPARTGRNPRTGEAVEVEEKWVPFFKTGKELRERLNADQAK